MKELYFKFPIFTLQKMSLWRIITTLSNNRQILRLIMEMKLPVDFEHRLRARRGSEWVAVHAMAKKMVLQVCHCVKINESIMELLWPMRYRIIVWKSIYAPSINNQFLQHFYWTDQGRINNGRTIKYIIENKNISVLKRFILACSVCLCEDIQETWWEMSDVDKMYLRANNGEKFRPILLFWVHKMKRLGSVPRKFISAACACAFDNGLLEALKHLFTISSKAARLRMAWQFTKKLVPKISAKGHLEEDEIDIFYFLYFELNDDCKEVLYISSFQELILLFYFSEREHFFDVLKSRLEITLNITGLYQFVKMMFVNYNLEINQDDDDRKAFVQIWRLFPDSEKKDPYFYHGESYFCLLIRDNFSFLLRKGASEKIAKLISPHSKSSTFLTPYSFHSEKWELLHFLIEKRRSSYNF